MKNKFPERAYIDLFAGPGHCVLDDDSGSIDGSPLVALSVPVRFSAYYFVEHNLDAMAALQTRVSRIAPEAKVKYYPRDANVVISDLVKDLPKSSLDVAVVDQTGLHFRFESLQLLTQNRKVDLIYLFPEGMDVKRNLERYLDQRDSLLDKALGTGEWRSRTLAQALTSELPEEEHWEQIGRPIVEVFRKQLHSIGYVEVALGSEIVVRNRRNTPLYYLVFASKHPLGHKFWDAIRRVGPTGQIEMPLWENEIWLALVDDFRTLPLEQIAQAIPELGVWEWDSGVRVRIACLFEENLPVQLANSPLFQSELVVAVSD